MHTHFLYTQDANEIFLTFSQQQKLEESIAELTFIVPLSYFNTHP